MRVISAGLRSTWWRLLAAGALVMAQGVVAPGLVAPAAAAGAIDDIPVAFSVVNSNTSGVPCLSNNAHYTIRGHLVGPHAAIAGAGPRSVTFYLHGLDAGEWFWHLQGIPGYDYATEMAKVGQVSVVIDRLGYGASGKPQGVLTCLGAQASIAHQVVQQLRSGGYSAGLGPGPSFAKVVLAGHSIGGGIAQVEAYSFHDVDALMVLLWADLGATQTSALDFAQAGLVCALGGQPSTPGGPGGYAYLVPSKSQFQGQLVFNAPAATVAAGQALQNRNPCGDFASTATAIAIDQVRVREVRVPVLLVYGAQDHLFSAQMATTGLTAQKRLYGGAHDLTTVVLPNTGHFMTLDGSVPAFRADVSGWLCSRGFVSAGTPCGP